MGDFVDLADVENANVAKEVLLRTLHEEGLLKKHWEEIARDYTLQIMYAKKPKMFGFAFMKNLFSKEEIEKDVRRYVVLKKVETAPGVNYE